MKSRWFATLVLIMTLGYALGSMNDTCDDSSEPAGQPCHIMCKDGCANPPMPEPPSDVHVAAARPARVALPDYHFLSLTISPELRPPIVTAL